MRTLFEILAPVLLVAIIAAVVLVFGGTAAHLLIALIAVTAGLTVFALKTGATTR